MLEIVDHIGVAVKSIEEALKTYNALGLEVSGTDDVATEKVKIAFLPVGETRIELLEATSPESAVAKFVEKRGAGVHHICFKVPDVAAALASLKEAGVKLIDQEPRPGAHGAQVAFIHPKATGGVLVELSDGGK